MTIKTLTDVTPQEALDATSREGSAALRDKIRKLARIRLGEGTALVRLQALLKRCERLTEKRNNLLHSVWAKELDGEPKVHVDDSQWGPPPTAKDLDELAAEMASLTAEINDARLFGFLSTALTAKEKV